MDMGNRMNLSGNKRGYTLIEMLIVVAIVTILAAMVVPSYQKFTAHQNLNGAARELFSDIRGARISAIKEAVQYGIYYPNATQFQVIKVASAPTYTTFSQANTAGLNPVYTVVATYSLSALGYYGITMTLPVNMPVFQKTGTVSSVNALTTGTPGFLTSSPDNVTFTSNYGETRVVSVNTVGYAQVH
jgi:prepilin-type N-terminal cleavage/methylation domain-containing protein